MKKLSQMIKPYIYILLGVLIALLAIALRLFRLSSVPYGLHFDEAGLGYNAWCLANHGVDRYLNYLPIYLQNYDSGQSPLYTYFCAFLVWLNRGNLSVFVLRLPAVLMGLLTIVFGALTIYRCLGKKWGLFTALLLTILPYYVMQSRFALDCNAMLFCVTMSLYFLTGYLYKKKLSYLILSGVSFGITMYSYSTSYIVLFLFLSAAALYLLYMRKITLKKTFLWALVIILTSLPIILFIAVILTGSKGIQLPFLSILPIAAHRAAEISFTDFGSNILSAILISLTSGRFVYNALPEYGTMYYLSVPFCVIGFIVALNHFINSLLKRVFHISSIFILFYIAQLFTIGLMDEVNINRINAVFVSLSYFLILGIYTIYHFFMRYRIIFAGITLGCYFVLFGYFANYYFRLYPTDTYPQAYFKLSAQDAVLYAQEHFDFDTLYIDYGGLAEYFCFENPVSPYDIDLDSIEYTDQLSGKNYTFFLYADSPISPGNVYIVRADNQGVWEAIDNSGYEYSLQLSMNYYYIVNVY